jgi:hypothetical protein
MAWVAVASWPVAFVVAMVVGEGLISMMGYQSGGDEAAPIGPALLAGIPALLILVTPGVAAVFYGHHGYRAGRAAARLPAWIGGAVTTAVVVVNLLALIVGR